MVAGHIFDLDGSSLNDGSQRFTKLPMISNSLDSEYVNDVVFVFLANAGGDSSHLRINLTKLLVWSSSHSQASSIRKRVVIPSNLQVYCCGSAHLNELLPPSIRNECIEDYSPRHPEIYFTQNPNWIRHVQLVLPGLHGISFLPFRLKKTESIL